MNKPHKALKYLKRFQCIGSDCEDTCCQGWRVNLYRDDFAKLRKLFQEDDALRPYLLSLDLLPEEEREESDYAALAFGNKNHCPMLDDGWCILHRDHGEKMLPRVCATFPKNIIELDDRVEVHGMLACPEIARLCLLETGQPQVNDLDRDLAPALYEQSDFPSDHPNLYQRYMPRVVEAAVWLMAREGLNESSKNYLITYLLKRISPFFRQEMEKDPEKRLTSILNRLRSPGFLEKTLQSFHAPKQWDVNVVQLVVGVVNATFKGERRKRYQDVCETVMKSYGEAGEKILRYRTLNSEYLNSIWHDYIKRREQVLSVFGDRTEQYFLNLSANFWSQSLYQSFIVPDHTAREFAMVHAVLRFLFLSHPTVVEMAADPQNPETGAVLDGVIVEVVQPFMKHIGANSQLVQSIVTGMEEAQLTNLTNLGMLFQV